MTASDIIAITDPDDPRIADYRAIRDRDLLATHDGRFVAEGETILRVLLDADRFPIRSILLAENRLQRLDPLLHGRFAGPVYVAGQAVMDAIVGFSIHRGVLALASRPTLPDAADLLRSSRGPVVGLVGIANHDNMGGIFRNAAAFGVGAVLVDDTCCDPLYRKAVRVSAGGVLRVPYARAGSGPALVASMTAAGLNPIALSPSGRERLSDVERLPRPALLLGTEGPGLPGAVLDLCRTVRIEMAGGFDSLNVATTSGIALYDLTR